MDITEARNEFVKLLDGLTPYQLAQRADCGEPDSADTAGSSFLRSVRDGVVGVLDGLHADDLRRLANDPIDVAWLDHDGELHAISANAPDVYTHTLWTEFVDLAAYLEEPDTDGDFNAMASWALFRIAERLVSALLTEAGEAMAEDEETDDDQ